MKSTILNRFGVAVMAGAVSLAGLSAPASAQTADKQDRTARKAERQQQRAAQKAADQKRQPKQQQRVVVQPRQQNQQPRVVTRPTAQPRQVEPVDAPVARPRVNPQRQPRVKVEPDVQQRQPVVVDQRTTTRRSTERARLPEARQRQLIQIQEQRLDRYRQRLNQQTIANQQARIERLREQKRLAQWRYQQEYWQRMREQQLRLQQARYYNYNNDPFFYTAPSYRYRYNNSWYEVNDYGANLLRQAVNYGYQEGFRAGQADRQDRWGYNYRDSFAYLDANYGYGGFYIDQDAYNYYFRQGFERGYEDGYYSRNRYGYNNNGTLAVVGSVLNLILNLTALD